MLRIALPNKGRLAEEIRELFADAGLEVRARGERALTASLGGEFEAIFARAQDIPQLLADGVADAGITGWDLVCESNRQIDALLDLGLGRCRLVVAVPEDAPAKTAAALPGIPRIATGFPRLARNYFERLGRQVELVPLSGAVEVAPHLGIADVIVDLTSSGSTLRMNRLRELDTVLDSSARLFARPLTNRPPELEDLSRALASVIRARDQRYVMANVPRANLGDVREILPGLNGPTVVDVYGGKGFVAVHAVVAAQAVYRTVGALKNLGAEGILVTRIERLLP